MSDSSKIHASQPANGFAFIYLRQSTAAQVEQKPRKSTRRQYALASRAVELGWAVPTGHRHRRRYLGLSGSGAVRTETASRVWLRTSALGASASCSGSKFSRLARKQLPIGPNQRRTKAADALIAGAYLAGNQHAPRAAVRSRRFSPGNSRQRCGESDLGGGEKGDWDAWNARSTADEPIMRLILDGTVVRVAGRQEGHVEFRSLSAAPVCGRDGQKVLLAIKELGGRGARPPGRAFARRPSSARVENARTRYRRRRTRPRKGAGGIVAGDSYPRGEGALVPCSLTAGGSSDPRFLISRDRDSRVWPGPPGSGRLQHGTAANATLALALALISAQSNWFKGADGA